MILKKILLYSFICCTLNVAAQGKKDLTQQLETGRTLASEGKLEEAAQIYSGIYAQLKKDSASTEEAWRYVQILNELSKQNSMKQQYATAAAYALNGLTILQDPKFKSDERFSNAEPWMLKNVIAASRGAGDMKQFYKYKNILYKDYKNGSLQDKGSIGKCFNFDFFRIGDKNIWGYEWYHEMPKNRFGSSFTKIVYYVYSTNPDGSDKEQLYRYHVLMFHQDQEGSKFAYILERQIEDDQQIQRGSYYSYVYNEDIDYEKLQRDIKEIVSNNIGPDSKGIIPKK